MVDQIENVSLKDLLKQEGPERDKFIGYHVSCFDERPVVTGDLICFEGETVKVKVKNKTVTYTEDNLIGFDIVQHHKNVIFKTTPLVLRERPNKHKPEEEDTKNDEPIKKEKPTKKTSKPRKAKPKATPKEKVPVKENPFKNIMLKKQK